MNLRTLSFLACLLLPILSACRVTHTRYRPKDGILLRQVEGQDGVTTRFRLYWGGKEPKVHRTTTRFLELPSLGVEVRTVTPEVAEQHDIPAFEGVFVDRVVRESPAALGGIRTGDVIVRVGGTTIASREQLEHVVQSGLSIGQDVIIEVGRRGVGPRPSERVGQPGGDDPLAESEGAAASATALEIATVTVTPGSRRVEVSKTEVIGLEHSPAVRDLTGCQVAGLGPALAAEIYGGEGEVVLVADVQPGTPAYRAGLRSGDRVLRCDGRPIERVGDLRSAVRARAAAQSIRMNDAGEVSATVAMDEGGGWSGDDEGPLRLEVEGPLGPHVAEVRISDRLDAARRFHVPIVVDYRSEVDRTRFSFLDFIFQFGWNYRSRYLPSETREPKKSRYFSLFPFGMFECKTDPDRSEYTFLWFITVGSG